MMRHPAAAALASYSAGAVSERRATRVSKHVPGWGRCAPQAIAGCRGRRAANTILCPARGSRHVAWARGYNASLALVSRSQARLTSAGCQREERPD